MTEDELNLVGGCLCGAIRYRISGRPLFVSQCCCKDCQKATGTGHTTIMGVQSAQMRMDGEPKTYTNTGDTGGRVTRHFCGVCAGRLFTTGDLPGDTVRIVQVGSLDDPNQVRPENVIYLKDAPVWDFFDPDIPKYEGMRPRPGQAAE